ncbi:hypothetical protein RFI_09926 [Reticulomyxa filosa]|uniref:inorganic diphosphatase n=1 Tax=Reticulomyxa filosa TaxID=46433 RepID=X6NMP8_RETFI|nr:hypothetical protein RFI_09926 [Reticulomyxa filosa]|eukprot:ETO27208.1 hypothetical protein RFI_09926 [Reticulomyxa filosa]
MECTPKEEWNPLKQDVKKGKLRFFKYGDLPFNYGFIPQTWEDPTQFSQHSDVGDLRGDNDPLDLVEISGTDIPRGSIVPVKAISVLGLIDEGEADWKIIAIRADHPKASQIHCLFVCFIFKLFFIIIYLVKMWFLKKKKKKKMN